LSTFPPSKGEGKETILEGKRKARQPLKKLVAVEIEASNPVREILRMRK